MERLTDKIGNTYCVKGCGSNCKYGFEYCSKEDWENCETIADVIDKLADYEELEEQGRLIKLPCKEAYTESGDIVYLIYDDEVVECTHCGLSINPVDGKAYIALATDEDIFPYRRPVPEYDLDPTDWCTNTIDAEVGEIGKTVFFIKSAAEEKLKELRGVG
jgi:hypothetical protein